MEGSRILVNKTTQSEPHTRGMAARVLALKVVCCSRVNHGAQDGEAGAPVSAGHGTVAGDVSWLLKHTF